MVYIQQQIISFSVGILVHMSKKHWFRYLWAVGRPPNPPSTRSTHSPTPDPSVWTSDILFRTAEPHLHPLPRAPHFHAFQPQILLIPPAGGRSKNSNQNFFRIPQPGSSQKNPTKNPSRFPSWVTLKLSNQKSFHITQLGSIQNVPRV